MEESGEGGFQELLNRQKHREKKGEKGRDIVQTLGERTGIQELNGKSGIK